MHIVMIGGTGFIGRHITPVLAAGGHTVTIATRNARAAAGRVGHGCRMFEWDPSNDATLERALHGQDAVINLAGAPIADNRWTQSRKRRLRVSRIDTTRMIVTALSRLAAHVRPTIFVSASGIGFYGLRPAARVDETTERGQGFLADLCDAWEHAAFKAAEHGIRTVCLRISMVLGHNGGALQKMQIPFMCFVGGPLGHGMQPVSWIHAEDLGRLINTVLEHDTVNGPVNAASPRPVTMKEFCLQLGKALGRPSWLPVPALALRIGLGERATLMTHGQWVHPGVATRLGFACRYPSLDSALLASVRTGARDPLASHA